MNNPNKGASQEVLRRLEEASHENFRMQLLSSIGKLLEDFEMTWDDLAKQIGVKRDGVSLKCYIGTNQLTTEELNKIAAAFSSEPYIIFKARSPWTTT
jgi:hypothetical protein